MSAGEGGGPRVRVFSGNGFGQIADFFGIDDPNFRGGARTAVGDVDGDGRPDLIVAAGPGGGPRVAVYRGATLAAAGGPKLCSDFMAFESSFRRGVSLAAADLDHDGRADVIVAGGPGGGPRVSVFGGGGLVSDRQERLADFFAADPASRAGILLAMKDVDADGQADVVAASGDGSTARVYTVAAVLAKPNEPEVLRTLELQGGFVG